MGKDTNLEDDYYSNIKKEDSSDSKKEGVKGKLKLKVKPKIKKPEVQKKSENNDNSRVEKKFDKNKKPFEKKDGYFNHSGKKDKKIQSNSSFNSNSIFQKGEKAESKKPDSRKDFSKKPRNNNSNESKTTDGAKIKLRGSSEGSNKKFDNENKFKSKVNNKKDFSKKEEREGGKKKFANFHKNKHRKSFFNEIEDTSFVRSNKLKERKKEEKKVEDIKQNIVDRTGETVVIPDVLTLKEFSEKIGVPMPKLIGEFMKNGMMVTINSKVDFDTASIISEAFEISLERDKSSGLSVEDMISGDMTALLSEDNSSKLETRSPVISIMGHVDHGKTSLLDKIREAKVAEGEAGGITQSIGAYQVEQHGQKITFLDTPGHEAFTVMRARGAKSTDIAILVVAADEGVKPQTIESINHAREAGIPIIVAINKMDKEGANPDHVKGQLAEQGLNPEDWGGDTPMVPVSAKTGDGVDDVLEMILLVSEMQELKANPNRQAVATVIESHLDTKLGPVATLLVNTGTINVGDSVVCKESFGKVRVLKNYLGKNIKSAGPSEPVFVTGFDKVVEGGDIMQVVQNIESARVKAAEYEEIARAKKAASQSGLDIIMSQIKSGNLKQLKIVLKADTNGSLEAIKGTLLKLSTEETNVSLIHTGVGNITESDVLMCEGSAAILVGFNTEVVSSAKQILEKSGVEFISSKIIYHISERIEKIITGMLDPKEVEIDLCNAEVGGIFYDDRKFMILGLRIREEEKIEVGALVRVLRKDKMVGKGKIESLKQGVEEVKSLEGPIECGIKFVGDVKVEEKDVLDVYKVEIHK